MLTRNRFGHMTPEAKETAMDETRFWGKSYDPDVRPVDPRDWEISYVDAVRPAFRDYP
jgi:hypothetical protein